MLGYSDNGRASLGSRTGPTCWLGYVRSLTEITAKSYATRRAALLLLGRQLATGVTVSLRACWLSSPKLQRTEPGAIH